MISRMLVRHTGHIAIATHCIAVSMSVPVHLLQAQCPHGKDLYHFQLKLSNYHPISNLSFLPFDFLPFVFSAF